MLPKQCCLALLLPLRCSSGGELSAAIASWQQRHQLAAVLSTGFLDGSHPIVDAYELGVRLQHMLRRLTALAAGSLVQVRAACDEVEAELRKSCDTLFILYKTVKRQLCKDSIHTCVG